MILDENPIKYLNRHFFHTVNIFLGESMYNM